MAGSSLIKPEHRIGIINPAEMDAEERTAGCDGHFHQ